MLMFSIYSRKLGHAVIFTRPGRNYIFLDMTRDQSKPGLLGAQPCEGGHLHGATLVYTGDDPARFEAICRRWWRKYNRSM